ncbi:MAG: hypothetical protein U1E97_00925 [Alphaproteobacteria bacterium]
MNGTLPPRRIDAGKAQGGVLVRVSHDAPPFSHRRGDVLSSISP